MTEDVEDQKLYNEIILRHSARIRLIPSVACGRRGSLVYTDSTISAWLTRAD